MNRIPISEEEKKIILKAKNLTEASEKSGRSKSACYQCRVKHKKHVFTQHRYTRSEVKQIRALLELQKTALEISEIMGISYYSIQSKIYRIRASKHG